MAEHKGNSSISSPVTPVGKLENQAEGRDMTTSEAMDDELNDTSRTSNINENDDTPAGVKSSISSTAMAAMPTSEALDDESNGTGQTSNVNENDDIPTGEKSDDGYEIVGKKDLDNYSESENLKTSDDAGASANKETNDEKKHSKVSESNVEGEKSNGSYLNNEPNIANASQEGVSKKESQLESKPCVCSSCCSCFAALLSEKSEHIGTLKAEIKVMEKQVDNLNQIVQKLQKENESLGNRYEDLKKEHNILDNQNQKLQKENKSLEKCYEGLEQENCENIEKINSGADEIKQLMAEIQRLRDDGKSSKEEIKQQNYNNEKNIESYKRKIDDWERKYSYIVNELATKAKEVQGLNAKIDTVQADKRKLDEDLKKLKDESDKKEKKLLEEIEVLTSKKPVDCGVPKNLFDDQRMTGILSQLQGFMSSDRGCINFIPKDSEGILEENFIIIPCINSSRVGSDISSALTNSGVMASGKKAILLVFNHQASHNARIVTPTRERLSDASVFTLCETIIDLVYWQGKMYECDANAQGIRELKLRLGMQ